MKTSERCKAFVKRYEGCELQAYPDPLTGGAPWTIGWGSTGPDVAEGVVWTQAQADERFEKHLLEFEDYVRRYAIHPLTQGQFDAFVSILYNVGPGGRNRDGIIWLRSGKHSTLLRKFNAGDIAGAEAEWEKWISPGSRVSKALLGRRRAELDELFRADYVA